MDAFIVATAVVSGAAILTRDASLAAVLPGHAALEMHS
jgi:hypothetical protein